jgi:NAD+ diphosphatase
MTVTLLSAAAALDRRGNQRADEVRLWALARGPRARFILMSGLEPLMRMPADIWFTPAELTHADIAVADPLFLGVAEGADEARFALRVAEAEFTRLSRQIKLAPTVGVRTLAANGALPAADVALIGLARSIFAWHDNTRFCGACGQATTVIDGGWKCHCSACARDTFPRIDPVVIMLVTYGSRCVLAHEPVSLSATSLSSRHSPGRSPIP